MRAFPFIILFIAIPFVVTAQPQKELERVRREKVETILRIQDRRTPHDGYLPQYLQDPDPVVRGRVFLAYASIQDTTVIGLLTNGLTDPVISIQAMAAFALGQTGVALSPRGRAALEYDLIWKRLFQTRVADRLIEEIGKFGTEQGLQDLMVKVGNVFPAQHTRGMLMSIARFAIRGILSADAVRYCLRFIKPAERTPWEAAYALQRIGKHPEMLPEIEHLTLLNRNPDPLVRMNEATLLGKLAQEQPSIEPLMKLAEFDGDWRVRVNALRALATFRPAGRDRILEVFKRALFDGSEHLQVTAATAITGFWDSARDTTEMANSIVTQLRYIAENRSGDFRMPVQGESAVALASILRSAALPSVKPTQRAQRILRAQLLRATGTTGAPEALAILLEAASNDDPIVVCGALDGLRAWASRVSPDSLGSPSIQNTLLASLRSGDVAITTTAASLLADSLFLDPSFVPALIETLNGLRVPDDTEAIQEIISTLAAIGDTRAVLALREQLKQPDRSVALRAADALRTLTGSDYTPYIRQTGEPLYVDFDFTYLASLPDTVTVEIETARGNIVAELYKNLAPFTVMNLLKLATQKGYYRGLVFHRIVPNFVVQGGDPRGDGWGGPGFAIRSEFTPLPFERGSLGIASAGKDTEGSQFFITHSPQPHLDGRYTLFGKVVQGMDVVDRIYLDDRLYDMRITDSNSRR